ncbi:DUF3037 domain-containing protein [Blastopirellula sp. J2-11]|uniref:DUF3037 domain-containing protein n=1 Tax=Blastopirellula sp. J2-11 TaxID=2943192 RepID=UPI0021C71BCD|nr:DUF3037 domain-containing protein [Blastopirellula sp. J2-11]UUO06613.1 DUF3037 domain-containing protein [Blastopirellula sp. J2-11]
MTTEKGYYSVIQYCPDLGRFEAANVGVLLFCPQSGFLQALTSKSNRRIKKFFGKIGHDWKRIDAIKKSLEESLANGSSKIDSLEALQKFIATRANAIQLSDPKPIRVTNAADDLQALYNELVGETPGPAKRENLTKQLDRRFLDAGIGDRIVHEMKVEVPILEKEIEIPFGFQNGRFNLITPARFQGATPDALLSTAFKWAVEGRSIYNYKDPARGHQKLVVVGQFLEGDKESSAAVRRVLQANDVKLYSTEELPELIDEIRRTGKIMHVEN